MNNTVDTGVLKNYVFSYFSGGIKRTQKTADINLLQFAKLIKDGKFQTEIDMLRSADTSEARNRIKLALDYATISGIFNTRSKNSIQSHSGLIQIDIDDSNFDIDLLKNDRYTLILFKSPSGNGIKIIVKIPKNPNEHKFHFDSLAKYYLDNFGIVIDKQCSDISRAFFVSYDPDIYVNTESAEYTNKLMKKFSNQFDKKSVKFENDVIDNDEILKALSFIPVKSKDDGNRDLYLKLHSALQHIFGLEKADELIRPYLVDSDSTGIIGRLSNSITDNPEKFIFGVAVKNGYRKENSIVKIGKSKIELNNTGGEASDDGDETEQSRTVYDNVKDFLESYTIRYNVIKCRNEILNIETNTYDQITDRTINTLYLSLIENGIRTQKNGIPAKDILTNIIDSNFIAEFDPIKDYFNGLEHDNYDSFKCVISKVFELITGRSSTQDEQSKIDFELFKTWLCIQAGLSTGNNISGQYYCLAFYGKSGVGKTSFTKWLVPDKLKEYYNNSLTDYQSKDTKISLTQNFIVNLDELGESSKHDIKKLKTLITQSSIVERLPYAEREVNLLRRAGFIGSFDKKEVLDDSAGNRRFIVIEMSKIDWKELEKINVDDIWAEALQDFYAKNYSREIDSININRNKIYEKTTNELELLQDHIDDLFPSKSYYTATEVLEFLQKEHLEIRLRSQNIGLALNQLGYTTKSTRINTEGEQKRKSPVKAYNLTLIKKYNPSENY